MYRTKRRVGAYVTFPEPLSASDKAAAIKNMITNTKKRQLEKGVKAELLHINMGYQGRDFIENNITAVAYFNSYKIPRILKRVLSPSCV